jgi:hypothetical protein
MVEAVELMSFLYEEASGVFQRGAVGDLGSDIP